MNCNSESVSVLVDIRYNKKLANDFVDFQTDYIFQLDTNPLVYICYNRPGQTYNL